VTLTRARVSCAASTFCTWRRCDYHALAHASVVRLCGDSAASIFISTLLVYQVGRASW